MRLIYTTYDPDQAKTFAHFLSSEGIENQLEMVKNDDWGKENYGDTTFRIWVIDEDMAEAAEKWVESFDKDQKIPSIKNPDLKRPCCRQFCPPMTRKEKRMVQGSMIF